MPDYPRISIVVPIRNEEKYIARTLNYLLNQDYPPDKLEILVGVGDSRDRTVEVVRDFEKRDSRVKYFRNPGGWSSEARTLGAKMAGGDIIIYIDGHTYIDNNQILKNTVRLMEENGVMVLSRPQFLDTPENSFFQKAVSLARKSTIGHGLDSTIYTTEDKFVDPSSSGATYRREVFGKIGYFDTAFDACEDFEFNFRCARAGLKSFTSMKLAVYYYPRATLGALFRQMVRYGVGRYRLARKHPSSLSPGTVIPPLFVAGMPLSAILGLFWTPLLYLFLGAVGIYLGAIVLSSLMVSARHGLKYLPVLLLIYPAIHIGLGWGFLLEMIKILFGFSQAPQRFKEDEK